jgi:cytochrome P450
MTLPAHVRPRLVATVLGALGEMQLKILWEEILPRFPVIEVVGPPRRVFSNFVRGYTELPVRIPA